MYPRAKLSGLLGLEVPAIVLLCVGRASSRQPRDDPQKVGIDGTYIL